MNDKELLEKYLIETKTDYLCINPYGYQVWNKLNDQIVNKFNSLGFKEIYVSNDDIFNIQLNGEEKYQMRNYIDFNNYPNHSSSSIYQNKIEGAKTKCIDILQAYLSITKNLLAIPLLSGKLISFDEKESYILINYGKDNEASTVGEVSYLGKNEEGYKVTSTYSSKVLKTLLNFNDGSGLVLNPDCAPIQIGIVPLKINEANVINKCRKLKETLENLNYRVDINEEKITEKEKLDQYIEEGVPVIIKYGPRDIFNKKVEIIKRSDMSEIIIDEERMSSYLNNLMKKIHVELLNKQIKHQFDNTINVGNIKELQDNYSLKRIINITWDGDEQSLVEIKQTVENAILFMPFNQELFMEEDVLGKNKAKYVITIIPKK